jgi:eukaryotic-like serine/threonine-protein kinase
MTRQWNDLEGVSLGGRYWLKQCLAETENDAWFLTRFDAACDAAVRIVRYGPGGHPAAADQLELWRAAMAIDHPHIVRMLDAGRTEAEGTDVLYAVCEYPDDFLVSALAERPLSTAEAREVLDACLSALSFLHERGLVHGAVAAEHIMAFGNRIKLPCDTIRRTGDPAEDLWELGATLVEILTRDRPQPGADIPWAPEPFGTIVQRTMGHVPTERWTVADIEAYLHPPDPVEVAAPIVPEPVAAREPVLAPIAIAELELRRQFAPEPPVRHGNSMKWVPLAGLAAAVGLGAFFLPHSKQPVAKPAVETAPLPIPPRVEAAPPVQSAESQRSPEAIWRVVVYEYSHRAAAEHKARTVNQKRPELHAEVFAPRGDRAPYLVALGGFMTRPDAERLKKQARAAGMPRDTFVRNYVR